MNTRRIAMAGIAALAVIGFAAGCGGSAKNDSAGSQSAAAASPTPAAPKAALLASTKQLGQQSYHYTVDSGGMTGTGATDPATQSGSLSMRGTQSGQSMKMDTIRVGTDVYLKMDAGQLNSTMGVSPDKWMHIDASKLGASGSIMNMPGGDQGGVDGLLAGVVNVQSNDGRNLSGTLDLTKVTGSSAVSAAALSSAGDKAKAVPFTATLDDQGRLASFKIDGSSIVSGLTVSMTFSDYGKPVTISKPAASSVVEAPSSLLQLFQATQK